LASSNSLFFDNKFFKLTSGSNSMGAPLRETFLSHVLSKFGEVGLHHWGNSRGQMFSARLSLVGQSQRLSKLI
jgi:hypothetical protein